MKSSHFANTQSRHDFCYPQLSPSLSTIYSYDNQSQRLFGDPVARGDYFETFDNQSIKSPTVVDARHDYALHEYHNNRMFDDEPVSTARAATSTKTPTLSTICSSVQPDELRHLEKSLVSSTDSDQLRANSDLFE